VKNKRELFISWSLWIIAIGLLAGAVYLAWRKFIPAQFTSEDQPQVSLADADNNQDPVLIRVPDFVLFNQETSIRRTALVNTEIPARKNIKPLKYQVVFNDSVFGIAANIAWNRKQFSGQIMMCSRITPILWHRAWSW